MNGITWGIGCRSVRLPIALVLLTATITLAACAPAPEPPPPGMPVGFADAAGLEKYLADRGFPLTFLAESAYVWFAVPGRTYERGEDILFVHTFASDADARAAARRVSPDGSTVIDPSGKPMVVQWLGKPHLYQNGPLLVVYVGGDPALGAALEQVLGPPFADAAAGGSAFQAVTPGTVPAATGSGTAAATIPPAPATAIPGTPGVLPTELAPAATATPAA
jgi:hypothetical protein